METRHLDSIVVKDRHRRDLGDLEPLKDSIADVGLLHPVVVTADGTLVAGERRLEACRELGLVDVPVTVVTDITDAVQLLKAERDENTCRLDMKPSEKVALGRELEELERPRAEARRRATQNNASASSSGDFPEQAKGDTRDIVGVALGWSGRTYSEAKNVVLTAEDDSYPEAVRAVAREAVEEMDRTQKVSPSYRKVARAKNPDLAHKHPLTNNNGGNGRARHQRRPVSLLPALTTLSGSVDALVAIPSDGLSIDDRIEAAKQLTHLISKLSRLRATVKGELHGS